MPKALQLISFIVLLCTGSSHSAISQETSTEMIHYFQEDGISYLSYVTYRSSFDSVSITTSRKKNFEEQVDYINPTEYVKSKNKLTFAPGAYAYMKNNKLENVKIDNNGVYAWKHSSKPYETGEFGICHLGGYSYSNLAYVWVLPEKFEYVNYSSNQDTYGEWVLKGNVLSFYGKNINNFVPRIKYKLKEKEPEKFLERTVDVNHTFETTNKQLELKIWDDLKEDGDIISISLNGEWIVKNLKIKLVPTEFTIDLDRKENYLLMYAENLGDIPPNTAVIKLNNTEYKLSSDLKKCEAIKIIKE